MSKKEKIRTEIADKYKWDLNQFYSNEQEWENDYRYVKQLKEDFITYKNKILDNSSNLLQVITLYMKIDRILSNLYMYAKMHSDEDTSNSYYQALKGRIENLVTEVSESLSFFEPELLRNDYEQILKFISEEPKLKDYQFFLEQIYRFKNHILSDQEERIISSMSKIFNSSSQTAGLLRDSDLKFGSIIDEEGEEVNLTNSNYSIYIESLKRDVRKQAFETMYSAYEGMKNTFASTLAGEVELNNTIAKIRDYSGAKSMSLYGKKINGDIYDNLITTINNKLEVLHKYYDLKKNILKLDEFNLYDVYVDLIQTKTKNYEFDEAKELIISALDILGHDYINNINKAFDEKWIDIYPNKGKRSGAYSSGTYDSKPYILLNYQGRIDDVSTLAHELGHSMHSYYSNKNNDYQYADYEIFVAEVASTVNELLLYKYMLNNSNDKNVKLTILNQMMELFRATLYRQTMFAEFELLIHQKAANGEILTSELLSNLYYDLNVKYFGNNVNVNEQIKFEWARIPHFYYKFYVYQYATGLSAACHIVDNILNDKDNALEKYLMFLKSGGSDYPVELLKKAGVDMNNPQVVESAINMFNDTIEEFIKLYNS